MGSSGDWRQTNRLIGGATSWLMVAATGHACPYCDSPVGKQVAAGIFNADFGWHALLTLLPFPFLLGIVLLLHFGWPWSTADNTAETKNVTDTILKTANAVPPIEPAD